MTLRAAEAPVSPEQRHELGPVLHADLDASMAAMTHQRGRARVGASQGRQQVRTEVLGLHRPELLPPLPQKLWGNRDL